MLLFFYFFLYSVFRFQILLFLFLNLWFELTIFIGTITHFFNGFGCFLTVFTCHILFRFFIIIFGLWLFFFLEFQILLRRIFLCRLSITQNVFLFWLLLVWSFRFTIFPLIPSNLFPFNLTLVQCLIKSKDFDLVRHIRAFDSASLSFFSLVTDEYTLIHLLFLLFLFIHLMNLNLQ